MSARDSAYAALGLRPGAKRADVDQAYRRLIKLYHPDRPGGDGGRAAEINRAYTMLRQNGLAMQPQHRRMPVRVEPVRRRRPSRAWAVLFVLLVGGISTFATVGSPNGHRGGRMQIPVHWIRAVSPSAALTASPIADFDQPLHEGVVDEAIGDAVTFHESGEIAKAAAYSRECQASLRRQPNLAWFDACVAFDEAIATLVGDDSLSEVEPFTPPEVVAREMAAARILSDDVISADSRLHHIRLQVEMQLLPKLDSAASAKP